MSVIVTNAKNRIAYNIVKSLGSKKIRVLTSDFVPLSMSFYSRYSEGHFIYPSPFSYPEKFIENLIRNIKRTNARVLIPVFEETFLISKFKNKLSKHVKMVLPDYDKILVAHNKNKWLPIAKRMGIPVPKTFMITDLRTGKETIEDLSFPVLIKPKQGGGAWAIRKIDSRKEFKTLLSQASYNDLPWERFFVQEYVEGETHCVAMLFNRGEYRAKITYRQLRDYPATGGQATLRISIKNERAEAYFEQILKELKWHGICQADFIVDRKNGTPFLVDINPRFWGSLTQGIASGVDFPYLVYKIANDQDVEPVKRFKTGVMTRWVGGDLRGFPEYLKRTNNKIDFIKDFFWAEHKRVFYDDFDISDPLPFLIWGIDSIYKIVKQKTLKPATHDSLDGIWE